LYGDADAIRALARRLDEQGCDIIDEAGRLVALAEACGWSGLAADAMRGRNQVRAAALHRTATRHEDAAAALRRHAREVENRLELIAAAERQVSAWLDEVGDLVGGFVPPSPGHRNWLDVDLPVPITVPTA
jgi:hypothetical protein